MADFPALPLWTDAYLADTGHLTLAEHGAYLLLLMAAWRSPDCSLPNDDQLLGRITRDPKNWPRVKPTVMAFWTLEDDGRWHQKRLTREREYVGKRVQQRKDAGLRSAARRAANAEPTQGSDPSNSVCLEPQETESKSPIQKPPNSLTAHTTASTDVAPSLQRNVNETATPTPTPTPTQKSKKEPPAPLRGAAPPTTKGSRHDGKTRGTRISPDWQPSPAGTAYAQQRSIDAAVEAEKFRDYWLARADARAAMRDWDAAWRTWVRGAVERLHTADQRGRSRQGPVSEAAAIFRVLDQRKD